MRRPTSDAVLYESDVNYMHIRHLNMKSYSTQDSYKLEVQVRPLIAVTNAVSWRSEGIWYQVLCAIKMKCYLSGMPELRLGLNDKVMFESTGRNARGKAIEMEDVGFHQCVLLSRFENDRTISFIPPDGEFELMSYRLSTPVKLIWIEVAVEHHKGSRIEYMVKVEVQFKRRSTANKVEIYVPIPSGAGTPKFRTTFVCRIQPLSRGREFLMHAHFGLLSVHRTHPDHGQVRDPVLHHIRHPEVHYLKIVDKTGYEALPWVRYIAQYGEDYRRMLVPTRCYPCSRQIQSSMANVARSLLTVLEKRSAPIVLM
ncbi:Mu homology domain-containing protein [Cubamyces menziesii]|nr:Mu homology domain-containing protein [Cubamyces menziesii]